MNTEKERLIMRYVDALFAGDLETQSEILERARDDEDLVRELWEANVAVGRDLLYRSSAEGVPVAMEQVFPDRVQALPGEVSAARATDGEAEPRDVAEVAARPHVSIAASEALSHKRAGALEADRQAEDPAGAKGRRRPFALPRRALAPLALLLLLAAFTISWTWWGSLQSQQPKTQTQAPQREGGTPDEDDVVPQRQDASPNKHNLSPETEARYNDARRALETRTRQGLLKAVALFNQVIAQSPRHAQAHAGLANSHSLLGYYGHIRPREAYRAARKAADEAVRLEPDLPEAIASRAWIAMTFERDWSKADVLLLRARERGYATAHQWYSFLLMARRDTLRSLDEIKVAARLDPGSRVIAKSVGQRYFHAATHDPEYVARAVAAFEKVLPNDDTSLTRYWLGLAYEQQAVLARREGKGEEAAAAWRKALSSMETARVLSGEDPDPAVLAGLGHVHAAMGNRREARKLLAQVERLRSKRYVSLVTLAVLYAGLGEEGKALDLLDAAVREGSPDLVLLQVEPRLLPLRDSSSLENWRRFHAIEKAVFAT